MLRVDVRIVGIVVEDGVEPQGQADQQDRDGPERRRWSQIPDDGSLVQRLLLAK
jgi:hypothetical protein